MLHTLREESHLTEHGDHTSESNMRWGPLDREPLSGTVTNKTVAILRLVELFGQYLRSHWAKLYKPIYHQKALICGFSNHPQLLCNHLSSLRY
jgi:hypothetical protein